MAKSKLPDFPDAFLKVREGFIYGKPGEWAIVLALEPFELDGEVVKTSIVMDAFPWEVEHPREMAGKKKRFSADDRDELGIEGSICVRHAHHPVDVSRIAFGPAGRDAIEASIDFKIDFDFEGGGFKNRSAQIVCPLRYGEPTGVSFRVIR